jgi:toxin ParE1/3/4
MSRRIAFARPAIADLENARDWYEAKRPGLGQEFALTIDAAMVRIAAAPEQFPVRHLHFRRMLVRKFPYAIYFTESREAIVVHAVMHMARNPDILNRRGTQ